jgi:hypothetical protein
MAPTKQQQIDSLRKDCAALETKVEFQEIAINCLERELRIYKETAGIISMLALTAHHVGTQAHGDESLDLAMETGLCALRAIPVLQRLKNQPTQETNDE